MALKDNRGFWLNKKGEAVHKDLVPIDDQLKDELVEELTKGALEISDFIKDFKVSAFEKVEGYYELLLQKYNIDIKKNSKKGNLTIENFSATAKVQIAVADRIDFDEKLSIAKVKIDEYLHEVTQNSSADIKTLITKAFEVDSKGAINAKKILSLKAYEIKHPKWIEAMHIIDDAIEIVSSKNYIRFYTRETTEDTYKQVALDIAGV